MSKVGKLIRKIKNGMQSEGASYIGRVARKAEVHSFNSARRLLRPVIRKSRVARGKAHKVRLLASSSQQRKFYIRQKVAQRFVREERWKDAARLWEGIIEDFSSVVEADAVVQLSGIYQNLEDYDAAEKAIARGMALYPRQGGQEAGQDDLEAWLKLSREKAEISFRRRLKRIEEYQGEVNRYRKTKQNRSARMAVVTAISGGYDILKPPVVLDERFDYILFTDTPTDDLGIFDVRPMPFISVDPTRSARYIKTNLHKLLSGYDTAVWVDANIAITGDVYNVVEPVLRSGKALGAMKHPVRRSPYQEMDMCIRARKDDMDAILEQRQAYRAEGYDSDELIESNILVYDLTNKEVGKFLDSWWSQIERYSRRDQLSINYCLDKTGLKWHAFTGRPNSSRNHADFALTTHGATKGSLLNLVRQIQGEVIDPYQNDSSYSQIKSERLAEQQSRSVDVVLCVHNALEDVKKCLTAIKLHKSPKQGLIIVDDGSDADTQRLLIQFEEDNSKWVRRLRNDKALGYTKAANMGMRSSKADFVILLNSDTIPTKNWIEKLTDAAYSSPGVGIVGPMSSAASTQSLPDHTSSKDQTAINNLPESLTPEDMNRYCEEWSPPNYIPRVPLVHGFCIGIKQEVLKAIGYFDDQSFPRGYGEENDLCFRAANAGFDLAVATHTYVFHSKSKSFVGPERKQLMEAGARNFRDKHGQRRISRAVETMKNNPILQVMRLMAKDLYARQYLQDNPVKGEILVDSKLGALRRFSHQQLVVDLGRANERLIAWKRKMSEKSTVKVSIVVLVLNNLEMTKRCIESILVSKDKTPHELIVVNNGSDISTAIGLREMRSRYPQLKLVHIDQNLNFALGNNVGFSYAKGEYCVFINNDTYVTDGWLDRIMQGFKRQNVKAVQPALFYPDGTVQNIGVVFSSKSPLGYPLYAHRPRLKKGIVRDRTFKAVTGACLAVRSIDFAHLKGFDTGFINGQEDVDFCLRLLNEHKKGVCLCAAGSIVFHDESKTPGRGRFIYENREAFVKRWASVNLADDTKYYLEDGFRVASWKPDSKESVSRHLAIFTPNLTKK